MSLTPLEAELHAWLRGQAERAIETACAHVFLGPDAAFKMKRHLDLGYVDFSTAERRRWALERELSFNRRTAPDIYRRLRRITREADGRLAFDGAGETLDVVLEMRRFDERCVLSAAPQLVDRDLADRLGRIIAGFHAAAPLRPGGGWTAMRYTVDSNARLLRELAGRLGEARVEALLAGTAAQMARQRPLLQARSAAGYARRCHGDLHLGNILLEAGQPVLFDCIEFDDRLSDIDVQYDLAFLLMDLAFRGRGDAAVRVLSAYLDEAGRSFGEELWEGLAALPLMLSVRAAVRVHVSAHGGEDEAARAYADFGVALLSPAPPVLVAVGGLSGSGKSSFARAVAPALGPAPGAVVLRTDEVRKRLLQAPAVARLPASAYSPELTTRTYDAMIANAGALLKAGHGVVLDATFMDPGFRARAERLALECGTPFHGVWLDAPAKVLMARIAGRSGDASDATVATLRGQLAQDLGPMTWARLEATRPVAELAAAWVSRDVA